MGDSLAQLIEVITVGEPAGEPQLGYVVAGVGQRADGLDGLIGPEPVG